MPVFFLYLIKLSISLAVVYGFYWLLLRRLTFYNHNRWYLMVYPLLCFLVPFIDISPALDTVSTGNYKIVTLVPALPSFTGSTAYTPPTFPVLTGWQWLYLLVLAGMCLLGVRLVLQFASFLRIRRKSTLVTSGSIRFYQVDADIIPFSFGNAIYLNQQLHEEKELKQIIKHEFVHIRQKHSLDMIFGELLCLLNWFNPFAWLIRKAIRQNLEFIADKKVLDSGTDRKQYQYLLLKVIGNQRFSISTPFNFSSLKKRIVMMNKLQTSKVHLLKMLFMLPLAALVLVAFRNGNGRNPSGRADEMIATAMPDTVPGEKATGLKTPLKNKPNSNNRSHTSQKNKPNDSQEAHPKNDENTKGAASNDAFTFIADTIAWLAAEKKLTLKGKAVVVEKNEEATINAELIEVHPVAGLVIIDGRIVNMDKDYIGPKGGSYHIRSLGPKDAVLKYGEKGREGALEIKTVAPGPVQSQQDVMPVFDLNRLFFAKPKDHC